MTVTTEDRPRVRPPIDPRIRERRIEVIREAGRRRLRVTLVVTSTIVALGVVYLGVHSPLLNVDHVRVTGAHQETTAQIVRAAGVAQGAALLFVDTGRIAGRSSSCRGSSTRVRAIFPERSGSRSPSTHRASRARGANQVALARRRAG